MMKRRKRGKVSKSQRYKRLNAEVRRLDNAGRRKRRDRRDCTVWHKRLRLICLHAGVFFTRKRDQYYANIRVDLTVIDLARLWFRDCAWMMKDPHCDRVDPEGHYEFGNCRFIEGKENLARVGKSEEETPF